MSLDIDTERWRRVEEIFHQVLETSGENRRRLLDDAAGVDGAVREEVESLLDAHEASTAFDEQAARHLAAELSSCRTRRAGPEDLDWRDSSPVGDGDVRAASALDRVGPYRLLELLGTGGMGTVFLAEQSEPLPRRVALKVMRPDLGSVADGEGLRRFELERETLARMSHPAIAQVFDAGATEEGRPYVVLEYIPGEPITTYCDSRRLDLRRRVELMVAVCDGVRHAHERAVIHRDLKPSNILVTDVEGEARPKIIDFGIAKALEPWSDLAASKTHSGLRVGSFSYMSPEALLAGGQVVDTRSDVYALGVVLCELLADVRPFLAPPAPGVDRGKQREAARPSRRLRGLPEKERCRVARLRGLDEDALARQLRPELDWIALRAIAHDPAERYASASDLAADLGRWLTGHPVEARPPSVLYRVGKAVRRHRVAFVAAALLASTILAFSIRSNVLKNRAETARVQAEELVGFMLDDLSTQLEPMGRLDLLESVSRRSLHYFESATDGALDGAGPHPPAALRQVGRVLASRGDAEAAGAAYERARRIDEARLRARPGDPGASLDLAEDLRLLSVVEHEGGKMRRAAALQVRALEDVERVIASHPSSHKARLLSVQILVDLASTRRIQGQVEEAADLFEEALERTAVLEQRYPGDSEVRHAAGDALYGLGLLAFNSHGDSAAGAVHFSAAAEIYRELASLQPEVALWRYRLAVLLGHGLTSAYRDEGHLADARRVNAEALELYQVLVREEPGNGRWAHAFGWELIRHGELEYAAGDIEAAAEAFVRSAAVQSALVARASGVNTAWIDGLASAEESLAEVLVELGRPVEALPAAESSLRTRRRIAGDDAEYPYYQARLALVAVLVAELRFELGDAAGSREALGVTARALEKGGGAEEPYAKSCIAQAESRHGALVAKLGSGSILEPS